ncbi:MULTISPECIES: helix-turn-helix domain-containing protein [Hyphomicrobiales]|uniref:Helix-turn-helix domain-containing protein n=1 Tax=Prosthecodimorpha staleyi TaxID=2840188 RepID=A0A947DCU4_9HYPH|nr:helix-turn-helix domain-containing protein [Prosthecodimorpha staleyi]MBT9292694.1 helix-turn-helix domain-containing protein [Prosthecodimorpha staleyi]
MSRKWDNHEIKAELARRGHTLTGLALDNGLHESACRRALWGTCQPGAMAIANALGVTVQELWPGRYIRRRRNPATPTGVDASPKCAGRADRGAAA